MIILNELMVLVPTKHPSPLQIVHEINNIYRSPFDKNDDNNMIDALGINQDLYILCNDRINVGDYCYDLDEKRFFTCGKSEDVLFDLIKPNVKKVIETTNNKINIDYNLRYAKEEYINNTINIYNNLY